MNGVLFLTIITNRSRYIKTTKFTDQGIDIIKIVAIENLHRREGVKESFALQLLEWCFLFKKWHFKKKILIQNC